MASSSGVQSFQQPFQCKECGLAFNSAESLEVHLQYHQENLMQQWAVKAQNSGEEKNNNMTKTSTGIKREFPSNNITVEGSEIQKKSPEYSRTTAEGMYGHPPTPQSYQSASSPYQNHENSTFSSNFQNFQISKSEGNSPGTQQPPHYQSSFNSFPEYFSMDLNSPYAPDVNTKIQTQGMFRYHPYGPSLDRPKSQVSVPHSSPAYPPQPTPSPSPKQCDKCGYVCESAAQLIEHNNLTHANNPQVHNQYTQNNSHFMYDQQTTVKEEDTSQNKILDLDSHKVVHPVWAEVKEDDKRSSNESNNPHSVSTIMNSWSQTPSSQANIFQGEHNMFINDQGEQKLFPHIPDNKLFSNDQKIYQPHQMSNQNFMSNSVTTTSHEMTNSNQQQYRTFDHLPAVPNTVISSTQVPPAPAANSGPPPSTGSKGANWKSNEARRPKTYQCTACNKWFTSSGHLKRHYNTTLHKNAVKSSGQPDPATLPISAHHHPSRESTSIKDDNRANSNSPREDTKSDEQNGMGPQFDNRLGSMTGLIQHPPNGPYDRQGMHHTQMHSPIAQHHTPLGYPSPLGGHMIQSSGFSNIPNVSPPNGDAGLSPTDSRGLLSMAPPHSFNMMSQPHMMPPMEATQFQIYPNGSAPHVSQATDITSNLSTTGEMQFVDQDEFQPLPSFAQIQAHRFGTGFANVGGLELATAPASYTYYTNEQIVLNEAANNMMIKEENDGSMELTLLSNSEGILSTSNEMNQMSQFSPTATNNNHEVVSGINYISEHTNVSYINVDSSQMVSQSSNHQPLVINTELQDSESKENFEVNTAGASPTISSTTAAGNPDESKTKCYDCDKVFNKPCYLTQHNRTCHNGDKPFKCPRCGKRFSDKTTFEEHIKKHAGIKPHKCAECPKMFNHKTDLRRHICCHTGCKPFACTICGKGFIRKDHMVKHMETHARKKGRNGSRKNKQ